MADNGRFLVTFLFSFFLFFTVKDLFISHSTAEGNDKEIPLTNLGSSKFMGHTMRILYCYSCGYRNAFDQYSDLLREKYPDIVVEGGNYPPSGVNTWLARLLTIAKLLLILGIMTATDISRYIGGATPSWWNWCLNNKIYSCVLIFLMCNMIEGQLVSTGAFEISLNDVPVWSKLETGRIPQPPELFQIINSQLRFQTHDQTLPLNQPMMNY